MSEYPSITSDDKLWSALSYVFAPIVGVIVLLIEEKKARPFIKYHAVQSIAASIAFFIVSVVLSIVTWASVACASLCSGWFSCIGHTRPIRESS